MDGTKVNIMLRIGISVFCAVLLGVLSSAEAEPVGRDEGAQSMISAQAEDMETDPDDLDFTDEEEEEDPPQVADPLVAWNRAMTVFNDKAYFWVLKPVALGYKTVVPKPAREGIDNFFDNLKMPVRLVGCLLQGKVKSAGAEVGRFLLNSTVGVLGFGNPARKYPSLNPDSEDLGQAFASWGIGNGCYFVWPIFGPSTLRDSFGMIGDWYLYPVTYVDPYLASVGIKTEEKVNYTSLRIGDYEDLKNAAIDPYIAFRDVYLQYRKEKVGK